MGAAALASCWLLVAGAATFDASVRTQAQARSPTLSEQTLGKVLGDVEVTPTLLAVLRDGTLNLQLGYAPRLVLRNVVHNELIDLHVPEVQQTGRAQLDWRAMKGLRLYALQTFTYGQTDFTTATGTPSATTSSVRYLSSESTAGMETTLGVPRLVLTGTFTWMVSGGLGDSTVPIQQGPRVTLSALYKFTPHDALTFTSIGTDSKFSTGSRDLVVQLAPGFRHRFDPRMEGEVTVGVGITRHEAPAATPPPSTQAEPPVAPSASALLSRRLLSESGQTLDLRILTRLTPFVDPVTSNVFQRAEGSATIAWALNNRARLIADVNGVLALNGPQQGEGGVLTGLGGQYFLSKRSYLEGTVKLTWTRQQASGSDAFFQWVASISLVVAQSGRF